MELNQENAMLLSTSARSVRRGASAARLAPGLLAGVVMSAMLGACSAPLKCDYRAYPDLRTLDYVLGAGDGIRINVWKNPELSTDAIVRPDGTVTMSLIGDIHAAGRTTKELRAEITRRLGTYIRSDETPVTVAVTGVNSYMFTVSGNVEHGGSFSPKYYVTVSGAISMAGGLNKFGNGDRIQILRTWGVGKPTRIPVSLSQIQTGSCNEMDIVIAPNDVVTVP